MKAEDFREQCRDYLMSVNIYDVSASSALEALGYGPDGLNDEAEYAAPHQEGRECYVEIKPEDELPPTHQVVIGIYDDSTAISYVWFNKEDSIWRYSLEGGGNVHAPEPESWLKKKAPPTNESKQER